MAGDNNPYIDISEGFRIEWDLAKGLNLWAGIPTVSMWLPTTAAGLMLGLQRMVGTERFNLCLQTGGADSTEGDWQIIGGAPSLDEGMARISEIAGAAGWGRWTIHSIDRELPRIVFRIYEQWEVIYQRALGVCWGSAMMAGKCAGIASRILGVACWTEQVTFAAKDAAYDEFVATPTQVSPQERMRRLVEEGHATGEDLRQALTRLESEVAERSRKESELRAALEKVQHQQTVLQRVETPIIQVWEGVLALPIIGLLHASRAAQLTEQLLTEITRSHARFAILDLTGVDVVDTATADQLTRIGRSIHMLGGQAIITGMRPAIAQTMTHIGLDLSQVMTMRNLQEALRYCIQTQR